MVSSLRTNFKTQEKEAPVTRDLTWAGRPSEVGVRPSDPSGDAHCLCRESGSVVHFLSAIQSKQMPLVNRKNTRCSSEMGIRN